MKRFLSVLVAIVLIFIMLFAFAGTAVAAGVTVLPYIPDPNLCNALCDALLVPHGSTITQTDLESLTGYLSLKNKNINDAEGIQFCTNIDSLRISECGLNSLPADMSMMTKLNRVDFWYTEFTTFPKGLFTVPNLESITLSEAPISSIDPGIAGCHNLRQLFMHNCELSVFEPALLQTNIEWLNISSNHIDELPGNITSMQSLTTLDISGNNLSELPPGVFNLPLTVLRVYNNNLSSIPDNIADCAALKNLDISGNQLERLPDTIVYLSRLETLNASSNRLYGLPEDIGHLIELIDLDISFNRISRLPESIGGLGSLYELNARVNRLTSLPESLTWLNKLDYCYLEFNFLYVQPGFPVRDVIDHMSVSTSFDYEYQLGTVWNLTAEPSADSVTLRWNPCPEGDNGNPQFLEKWVVDGYVVYLNDNGLQKIAELGPNELEFTHNGLGPDEHHEYWVGVDYRISGLFSDKDAFNRYYSIIQAASQPAAADPDEPAPVFTQQPLVPGENDPPPAEDVVAQHQGEVIPGEDVDPSIYPDDDDSYIGVRIGNYIYALWAVILVPVLVVIALGLAIFFIARAHKKRNGGGRPPQSPKKPKTPKAPKPSKANAAPAPPAPSAPPKTSAPPAPPTPQVEPAPPFAPKPPEKPKPPQSDTGRHMIDYKDLD